MIPPSSDRDNSLLEVPLLVRGISFISNEWGAIK